MVSGLGFELLDSWCWGLVLRLPFLAKAWDTSLRGLVAPSLEARLLDDYVKG